MSYHVLSHNMLKWIILTRSLLYNYLNWHLYIKTCYMVATSWISCFFIKIVACIFWNLFIFFRLEAYYGCFSLWQHSWPFFSFLLIYCKRGELILFWRIWEIFLCFMFITILLSSFYLFFGNVHGPSSHLYLYIVREKNTNLKK